MVLLHSPLVGVQSWGTLPDALRRGGMATVAVAVDTDVSSLVWWDAMPWQFDRQLLVSTLP